MDQVANGAIHLTLGLAVSTIVLKLVARFNGASLLDDAFMYQRYAYNILKGHGIAWNPGGEPTYGLTSPLFLAIAVPVRAVAGLRRPVLAQMLSSLISGAVLVVLLVLLTTRANRGPAWIQRVVLLLALFSLAISQAANHFVFGMDTPFGMAYFAGYLLLAAAVENSPSRVGAIVLGAVGGLSLLVRPELGLAAVLTPACLAFSGDDAAQRRAGRIAFSAAVSTLALSLVTTRLYFHSFLPLPFYAKVLHPYGPAIQLTYRGINTTELLLFIGDYWPLLGLIGLDFALGFKRWWRLTAAVEKAAAATVVLLIGYEWMSVLQIMPQEHRFYQPVVPALVFLAGRAGARLQTTLDRDLAAPAACVALLTWFWLVPALVASGQEATKAVIEERVAEFRLDTLATEKQREAFKIAEFCALPDDAVIATSEIGLISVLAPKKHFIDLAGLNDTDIALHGFSAARLFARAEPDILYFPHPNYREMIKALLEAPQMANYDIFPPSSLGSTLGVGIKRTSRHYERMQQIMANLVPVAPDKYDPSLGVAPPGAPSDRADHPQ